VAQLEEWGRKKKKPRRWPGREGANRDKGKREKERRGEKEEQACDNTMGKK